MILTRFWVSFEPVLKECDTDAVIGYIEIPNKILAKLNFVSNYFLTKIHMTIKNRIINYTKKVKTRTEPLIPNLS